MSFSSSGFFNGVDDDELWRLLPPPEIWSWRYIVEKSEETGELTYFRVPHTVAEELDVSSDDWVPLTAGLVNGSGLPGATAYEILAFLSQANAAPVGTKQVGWFDTNTNLFSVSAGLIDLQLYDSKDWASHSFQFHHDAATTWEFWAHVKQETGFGGTY